jgi:hypothetical protein
MINATDRGFEVRPGNFPTFTESHRPGARHTQPEPSESQIHHLKYKGQTVLIDQVKAAPDGGFKGVIKGFEPAVVEFFGGISVGESIIYEAEHIFRLDK